MNIDLPRSQYLRGRLARNCDTYLDELQSGLELNCGVAVSLSSVWRALDRSGFTLKKVSIHKNIA
jgi:transposase